MSDDDMIRRGDALAEVLKRHWPQSVDAARAIAALPAVQPVVKVKPLAWKWSDGLQGWRADCNLTRDVFIAYQTRKRWSAGSQMLTNTYHPTADEAKAHLDQMRAARILAALDAHQPTPDVSALVEALKKVSASRNDATCRMFASMALAAWEERK
jgi:hypothetical protein